MFQSLALFESSVNSYGSQTGRIHNRMVTLFESSVNSYGSQTHLNAGGGHGVFESSVNSYGSQTLFFCYLVLEYK